MLWQTIVDSFSRTPRDVQTIPLKGHGIWFYVFTHDGKVFVSKAKCHTNSSKMQGTRLLDRNRCDAIFELYQRRKVGKPVSQEASAITQNQVYWYGIFHNMNL